MAGIVVFSREECETSDTSDAQKKINKLDAGEAVARLARGCYRFRAVCKILSILRWRIHSIELRCAALRIRAAGQRSKRNAPKSVCLPKRRTTTTTLLIAQTFYIFIFKIKALLAVVDLDNLVRISLLHLLAY